MRRHFPGLRHYGFIFNPWSRARRVCGRTRGEGHQVHSPHLKSLGKTMMAGIVTFKITLGGQATGHYTLLSNFFEIVPNRRIYRIALRDTDRVPYLRRDHLRKGCQCGIRKWTGTL